MAARYGGEEFALILPDSTEDAARSRAMEAVRAVAALDIEHRGSDVARLVTLSLGITGCVPDASVVADTLVERADRALYAAKRAGRNMAVAFSELPLPSSAQSLDLDLGEPARSGIVLH